LQLPPSTKIIIFVNIVGMWSIQSKQKTHNTCTIFGLDIQELMSIVLLHQLIGPKEIILITLMIQIVTLKQSCPTKGQGYYYFQKKR